MNSRTSQASSVRRYRPAVLAACGLSAWSIIASAAPWPQWRGPTGDGIAPAGTYPVEWSPESGIAWKTPLPGPGNSTPIVWGDRVFITCALDKGARRAVLCFNRDSGNRLWLQAIPYSGKELTHSANPYCSSSPLTDGDRVYAWHGSAGMVAYTLDGQLVWRRDLGEFQHIWGNGSTPVLVGDRLIAYCGPGPRSMLIALDRRTGKTIWQHPLPEAAAKEPKQWLGTWASPVLRRVGQRTEFILPLPKRVVGFDVATGKPVWWCRGLSDLSYASCALSGDLVVAMSGYRGPAIGLEVKGEGDLTEAHRLWRVEKNDQRIGGAVFVNGRLYVMNATGKLQCLEPRTGRELWNERVAWQSWSSLVYAAPFLYAVDMEGYTFVIRPGEKYELVAQNAINEDGEVTRASPAFSDGQIFIRTYEHLYCVGRRSR